MTTSKTRVLKKLADDLWVLQRPLKFVGMQLGTRMSVVRFGRDLLLHSPVAPDDALLAELAELGEVRWVVGPNTFHHLYLGAWTALGADAWAVSGLHKKRSDLAFAGVVGQDTPWPDTLQSHCLASIPISEESVYLHAPSRTLIVTDLLFNLNVNAPWTTRAMMRVGGGYPGVRCSHLERTMMKRAPGRIDLAHILSWDFDRIVLAHGDIVERGGPAALAKAYAWLER